MLSKINYITIQQEITIYSGPLFNYGHIFLLNIIQKTIDKLQKLENTGLRICLAWDGKSNVNELHNTCNINKLMQRKNAHLLNFVGNRKLMRFYAAILKEIKSKNK